MDGIHYNMVEEVVEWDWPKFTKQWIRKVPATKDKV